MADRVIPAQTAPATARSSNSRRERRDYNPRQLRRLQRFLAYRRPVQDAAGNLFGSTGFGGADYDGTIFEIAHGSGTITTLASFNGTDGADPQGSLMLDGTGTSMENDRIGRSRQRWHGV